MITTIKPQFLNRYYISILIISIISILFLFISCNEINSNSNDADKKSDIAVPEGKAMDIKTAKEFALDFVKNNMIREGQNVDLKEINEEKGLFKLKFALDRNEITSYMTKDGALFFPSGMDIADIKKKNEPVPKTDKPKVELFVMSYCPYGTQIQKGILPVVERLKDKIDFEVKFVNYVMHDKKEIDENILQYCIQKNYKDKYLGYLKCFLKEGKSEDCITEMKIDKTSLDKCIAETDETYSITKDFKDPSKSKWHGTYPPFAINDKECNDYDVKSSPTVIINGKAAKSGRDAKSLLNVICDAFKTKPDECSKEIDDSKPAPGFGFNKMPVPNGNGLPGLNTNKTVPPQRIQLKPEDIKNLKINPKIKDDLIKKEAAITNKKDETKTDKK